MLTSSWSPSSLSTSSLHLASDDNARSDVKIDDQFAIKVIFLGTDYFCKEWGCVFASVCLLASLSARRSLWLTVNFHDISEKCMPPRDQKQSNAHLGFNYTCCPFYQRFRYNLDGCITTF